MALKASLAVALVALMGTAQAQTARKTPYWAAIAKSEAVMRVGPSRKFPANWVYLRRDLPVRVLETYPNWRKIEDPDGTTGWMHVRLLKDDTTAIVKGSETELRDKPDAGSKRLYRLAPGVVGKLSGCASGWCAFEVQGKSGYVKADRLWGAKDE